MDRETPQHIHKKPKYQEQHRGGPRSNQKKLSTEEFQPSETQLRNMVVNPWEALEKALDIGSTDYRIELKPS